MKATLHTLLAVCTLLYGVEASADNTSPSHLSEEQRAALKKLVPADMDDFFIHDEPRPFRDKKIDAPDGEEIDLHAFDGHVTLLNFWATWCPPCRAELPGMDRLQAALEGDGLKVIPVSIDRTGLKKAGSFWKKAGFKNIDTYADSDKDLARQMGVTGIPVSAILGPDGREIARLVGDAEWDSDEAQEMLRFVIKATGAGG